MNTVNTVLSILALIAAFVIPLGIDRFKQPQIDVIRQPHGVGDEHGFRILHVQVYNRPHIRWPVRWVQVAPLYAARVHLSYFRSGQRLFNDVVGIWSDRPRPLLGGNYDPERASEAEVVDLFARDQPWSVPVAIKFAKQDVAYGFRAQSYRYGNPGGDPDLQIPANAEVELVVRVVGGSPKQPRYRFLIRNFGSQLQQFEILERS